MKIVGIIGGIGPESTIDYYRSIISLYRAQKKDNIYPRIIINSINLTGMLDLISGEKFEELIRYCAGEIQRLADAGADFALFASNTPHIVFYEVQKIAQIPLISIIETACARTVELNLNKLGLFGTRFTMRGDFYTKVFSQKKISIITPDPEDQTYIHDKYMNELVNGIIKKETKTGLLKIADKLKKQHHIEGLLLGGTELSLILNENDDKELSILDTSKIHVERIVEELLAT